MAHDVFISHSSKDKTVADAVCATLESAGVRCWIAPRDVQPGRSFAGEITRAIQQSQIMVLIFSVHSNDSDQVLREVQLAVNAHLHIIQFRIENVHLNDDLRYFLSTPHWLDALTPPLEAHIERLTASIRILLAGPSESASIPGRTGPVTPGIAPPLRQLSDTEVSKTGRLPPSSSFWKKPKNLGVVAGTLVVLFLGGWWGTRPKSKVLKYSDAHVLPPNPSASFPVHPGSTAPAFTPPNDARTHTSQPSLAQAQSTPAANPQMELVSSATSVASPVVNQSTPTSHPVAITVNTPAPTFDEGYASAFAQKLVNGISASEIDLLVSLYHDRIDYLDKGLVGPDTIREEYNSFFGRWPQTTWSLTGPVNVERIGEGKYRLTFPIYFNAANRAVHKQTSGNAQETLVVAQDGAGEWKIIFQRETILHSERTRQQPVVAKPVRAPPAPSPDQNDSLRKAEEIARQMRTWFPR